MSSYDEAIRWMDANHPFFVTPLINLGKPTYTSRVSTLAVEKWKGDFRLLVNPEFMKKHTAKVCAGLLCHELYHIVFNHLAEGDQFENHTAMIIAQECIVNDSVLAEGMELPDDAIYGMDRVKYDTSFLPTKIVYDDLMKNPDDLEDPKSTCSNEDDMSDLATLIFKTVFGGVDLSQAPESMKIMLEDAAQKAGVDFQLDQASLSGKKISMDWTKLINKIHPETFTLGGKSKSTGTWARPRRKLAGMPERIMLPDRKDRNEFGIGGNRRPQIVLALDTSGSIPRDKVQELLDLANSIPSRKVEVHCCTFSTYYQPLDLKSPVDEQVIASGGTDFIAVSDFVSSLNKPDLPVIVITDGEATFGWGAADVPTNLNTHWHWLVLGGRDVQDRNVTKNKYTYESFIG